jgi:hypothetical protein
MNVAEFEPLCAKWLVFGKPIRKKVSRFVAHAPDGQSLWLAGGCLLPKRGPAPERPGWFNWLPSTFGLRFWLESSISEITRRAQRNT